MCFKKQEMKDKLYKQTSEFGTNKKEDIDSMLRYLERGYNEMRINHMMENPHLSDVLCGKNADEKNRRSLTIKVITKRNKYIDEQRHQIGLDDTNKFTCPLEDLLRRNDIEILTEQINNSVSDSTKAAIILRSIFQNYTLVRSCVISTKLSDYNIDKFGNATIKTAKERFDEMWKEKYQEDLDNGEDYSLGMAAIIAR